jgi:hypothetical protein
VLDFEGEIEMANTFYVKNASGDLIQATFLVVNGAPVTDPNKKNAQNIAIFNEYGDHQINANPNGYLIVPVGYSVAGATLFGLYVKAMVSTGAIGAALSAMINAFVQGGNQDLQRNYIDETGKTISNGPITLAFQDAASFNLGFVTVTCPCKFPPRGVRVRPSEGRTDEASQVYGRADYRRFAGA